MKNSPATPNEMIVYYAGLRDEYENPNRTANEKELILKIATKRFEKIDKNDLDNSGAFKEGVDYNWDELGLGLPEEYWIIKDEKTGKLIGVESGNDFSEVDGIIEEYRNLPDHYTVELEQLNLQL